MKNRKQIMKPKKKIKIKAIMKAIMKHRFVIIEGCSTGTETVIWIII